MQTVGENEERMCPGQEVKRLPVSPLPKYGVFKSFSITNKQNTNFFVTCLGTETFKITIGDCCPISVEDIMMIYPRETRQ